VYGAGPVRVVRAALRDWWDDWITMIVISVLWLLSWLTLIGGPPATLGIYYVTHSLAYGQALGVGGFIAGARRYVAVAWRWMLANVAAAVLIWSNLAFYGRMSATWASMVQGAFLTLGLVWLVVQFFTLPFLIEQEQKSVRVAWRNSLHAALVAPADTLRVIVVASLVAALSLALFPVFLGSPGLIAALGSRVVRARLEEVEQQDEVSSKE
jgi:uncharacterized membrane protein YesL